MQFYCPRGHLLECSESQIGQRSRCPNCGADVIVPSVAPTDSETSRKAAEPTFPFGPAHGVSDAKSLQTDAPLFRRPGAQFADVTSTATTTSAPLDEERLVHIPCPAGHELETPVSMIGRDVMCPICRAEFRLHYSDSREHRTEQQQERLRREQKIGRTWMTWSLVAAALVLFGFALMIALAMSN